MVPSGFPAEGDVHATYATRPAPAPSFLKENGGNLSQKRETPSEKQLTMHELGKKHHMLPREKLQKRGASALDDAELLAIILGFGFHGKNVLEVSNELLEHFSGSLTALSKAGLDEITVQKGIGNSHALKLMAIFEIARRILREKNLKIVLDTPEKSAQFLQSEVAQQQTESFFAIPVNHRMVPRVEALYCKICEGATNFVNVQMRDIFKKAIQTDASYLILAHNHPSGALTPSLADIEFTRKVLDACKMMKIPVLDHVIVGITEQEQSSLPYYSMRENRDLDFS